MITQKAKWQETERLQKEQTGWDFSFIDGLYHSQKLLWDYKSILLNYLSPTDTLLDMGTGGGEFLLSLKHPHKLTCVTEGYAPNVALIETTLAPLGITTKEITDDAKIPYPDNAFDVVINRHESFVASEVYRVLKPGGYFITQQVGGENNLPLSLKINSDFVPAFPHINMPELAAELEHAKFQILAEAESKLESYFTSVDGVVFYAGMTPWESPGFSVETHFDQLLRLQQELADTGKIMSWEHRLLLLAKKGE